MYNKLTESVSLTNRTCLQENEDLKAAKKEFNTLFVRQREEQDNLRKVGTHGKERDQYPVSMTARGARQSQKGRYSWQRKSSIPSLYDSERSRTT